MWRNFGTSQGSEKCQKNQSSQNSSSSSCFPSSVSCSIESSASQGTDRRMSIDGECSLKLTTKPWLHLRVSRHYRLLDPQALQSQTPPDPKVAPPAKMSGMIMENDDSLQHPALALIRVPVGYEKTMLRLLTGERHQRLRPECESDLLG